METECKALPQWMQDNVNNPIMAPDILRPNVYELVPYLVSDGKKHKTAIICPGGGYDMVCSYVEGAPFARRLNELGYNAVVVYYRCRELAAYPGPQDDLARAVAEIHRRAEEWNLDMVGYSLWGSSAGGHLAGSFGTDNMGYLHYGLPKPGAMVLIYPVVTMGESTHEGTRNNLIGPDASPETIRFASVEQQTTGNYPPTYVWCGDADTCVPPVNSHMLAQALEKQGVPCKLETFPGIDHGVGLGTGTVCEGWLEHAVDFWMSQIGPCEEIQNYYLAQDYNCGEATLRILNDRYDLGLQEQDFRLVSGFGGGCGCGVLCGALAAAIAAMGSRKVTQRAHITPGFKEDCAALCSRFAHCVGSTDCAQIRPRFFREDTRCADVLQAALDCFAMEKL